MKKGNPMPLSREFTVIMHLMRKDCFIEQSTSNLSFIRLFLLMHLYFGSFLSSLKENHYFKTHSRRGIVLRDMLMHELVKFGLTSVFCWWVD